MIVGTLAGAGAGALILGWDASLDVGSSFIGLTRDWWPLHAMVGALGGAVIGLGFVLFTTFSRAASVVTLAVGFLIGCFGVLVLLIMNSDRLGWEQRSVAARIAPCLLSIFVWPLIGLLNLKIAGNRQSQISLTRTSTDTTR
ncbi:MAG TPA: hypothetical protein VJT71_09695 [Pyrinomonadaceae bacterium]|nr:hypothetical protein [Pyrinomonadaceae bacterium]